MIGEPHVDEYPPLYASYVDAVRLAGGLDAALDLQDAWLARIPALPTLVAGQRYAPEAWTVADVVGHMADAERVYSYRLLALARGEQADLPNFDEGAYASAAMASGRDLASLGAELLAVRRATRHLLASLDAAAAARRGLVRGQGVTARAMAWVVAGHVAHHIGVLARRYALNLRA